VRAFVAGFRAADFFAIFLAGAFGPAFFRAAGFRAVVFAAAFFLATFFFATLLAAFFAPAFFGAVFFFTVFFAVAFDAALVFPAAFFTAFFGRVLLVAPPVLFLVDIEGEYRRRAPAAASAVVRPCNRRKASGRRRARASGPGSAFL
jgi:hypothetical protein